MSEQHQNFQQSKKVSKEQMLQNTFNNFQNQNQNITQSNIQMYSEQQSLYSNRQQNEKQIRGMKIISPNQSIQYSHPKDSARQRYDKNIILIKNSQKLVQKERVAQEPSRSRSRTLASPQLIDIQLHAQQSQARFPRSGSQKSCPSINLLRKQSEQYSQSSTSLINNLLSIRSTIRSQVNQNEEENRETSFIKQAILTKKNCVDPAQHNQRELPIIQQQMRQSDISKNSSQQYLTNPEPALHFIQQFIDNKSEQVKNLESFLVTEFQQIQDRKHQHKMIENKIRKVHWDTNQIQQNVKIIKNQIKQTIKTMNVWTKQYINQLTKQFIKQIEKQKLQNQKQNQQNFQNLALIQKQQHKINQLEKLLRQQKKKYNDKKTIQFKFNQAEAKFNQVQSDYKKLNYLANLSNLTNSDDLIHLNDLAENKLTKIQSQQIKLTVLQNTFGKKSTIQQNKNDKQQEKIQSSKKSRFQYFKMFQQQQEQQKKINHNFSNNQSPRLNQPVNIKPTNRTNTYQGKSSSLYKVNNYQQSAYPKPQKKHFDQRYQRLLIQKHIQHEFQMQKQLDRQFGLPKFQHKNDVSKKAEKYSRKISSPLKQTNFNIQSSFQQKSPSKHSPSKRSLQIDAFKNVSHYKEDDNLISADDRNDRKKYIKQKIDRIKKLKQKQQPQYQQRTTPKKQSGIVITKNYHNKSIQINQFNNSYSNSKITYKRQPINKSPQNIRVLDHSQSLFTQISDSQMDKSRSYKKQQVTNLIRQPLIRSQIKQSSDHYQYPQRFYQIQVQATKNMRGSNQEEPKYVNKNQQSQIYQKNQQNNNISQNNNLINKQNSQINQNRQSLSGIQQSQRVNLKSIVRF